MNVFRSAVSALLCFSACGGPMTTPPPPPPLFGGGFGGSSGTGSGSGTGSSGGTMTFEKPKTSCQETLNCMFACPEGDEPCQNTCYANGSDDGNAKLLAFAQCANDSGCTDADCIVAMCSESLLACADQSRPPDTAMPAQNAPPGSVPSDLAGRWSGARGQVTTELVLNADGSGEWNTHDTVSYYACTTSTATLRSGTMVVADKQITLYASNVTRTERVCTPGATQTAQPAATFSMHWSRSPTDPNIIFLVDEACAAQFPGQENCEYAGCPIGMWCTSRLTRE
ncbi:MAG: hypothetical protein JNM17_08945 [Archangium sp.]|nr:hypothetical protein [Archangium sp.]